MSDEKILETIKSSPLAKNLTDDERNILSDISEIKALKHEQHLATEGDEDSYLYVVMSGSLLVKKMMHDGSQEILCHLEENEVAGISGFVDGQKRLADMVAKGRTEVLAISRHKFQALIKTQPEVVYKVMCTLVAEGLEIVRRLDTNIMELDEYMKKIDGHY